MDEIGSVQGCQMQPFWTKKFGQKVLSRPSADSFAAKRAHATKVFLFQRSGV
jgi:hypothetical protein